ncbi:MAG: hypothetical protein WBA91_09295 [Paracoccaceae bacterium]
MKYLILSATILAAATPAFADPSGCHHGAEKSAQISCADGKVWDEKSAICVEVTG